MSLSFTKTLEQDAEKKISKRFPELNQLFQENNRAILYPAGRMARYAVEKLKNLGTNVIGFGDSNPSLWRTTIDSLPVFSPEQIHNEYLDALILIVSSIYDSEIIDMLSSLGCKNIFPMPFLNHCLPDIFISREYHHAFEEVSNLANHKVINEVYNFLDDDESKRTFASKIDFFLTFDKNLLKNIRSSEPIYFPPDIVQLSDHEVFIDGGAYTGDTLTQIIKLTDGKFISYHAFEPDPNNFLKLKQNTSFDPSRIILIQKGLFSHSGHLRFLMTANVDAKFIDYDDPTSVLLSVIKLDDYCDDNIIPTFIKMDIEGTEIAAIEGARQLITKYKPFLAISIYHNPGDLWNIPYLIHQIEPDYHLFIRHYTREVDDTVCYAVPDSRIREYEVSVRKE
jgi:FkbM family methyltransferase